ncbi:MAG: ATP-binding cassette domain-containing protein, partial [Actinophytocola sp.]|nr:ATP-binding cassette domain-containing protein [Actinophytocola sp.]
RLTTGAVLRRTAGYVHAVDGVSLTVADGESVGLIGESGCGKSSVARCIVRLLEPDAGRVVLDGHDITHTPPRRLRALRRTVQMVFQDPDGSLDPRMTVERTVAEPIRFHHLARDRADARRQVTDLLDRVGLATDHLDRYPHELSGGQRQRLGIARALATQPRLLVLDEPVSALDVSIQAQILTLLADLRAEFGLSYLLISHDLSVVRHVCQRVAVMHLGQLVETADVDDLFAAPHHPYTQALISAVPEPDPIRERQRQPLPLAGEVASATDPPPGCRFHTRCFKAQPTCSDREPPLDPVNGSGHAAACFYAEPLRA